MNPYIPKDWIYPKIPDSSFWVKAQYVELMGKGPYKLIRPVFIWDYPTWHKTQYETDPSKRMKYGQAMVPILTGVKTKDTRIYMEGLMEFIRTNQWVCLSKMELDYFNQWIDKEEYKSFSLSDRRYKTLRLRGNSHRRMILAYVVMQFKVLTRENWDTAYQYIYSRTINEYLMLMEAAIQLPKEWCDDEYINGY